MAVTFERTVPVFRIFSLETEVTVIDPFNNRIVFGEPTETASQAG